MKAETDSLATDLKRKMSLDVEHTLSQHKRELARELEGLQQQLQAESLQRYAASPLNLNTVFSLTHTISIAPNHVRIPYRVPPTWEHFTQVTHPTRMPIGACFLPQDSRGKTTDGGNAPRTPSSPARYTATISC
jgi:hypothetical protein